MSGPRKVKLADMAVDFPSAALLPLNDCTDRYLAKDWAVRVKVQWVPSLGGSDPVEAVSLSLQGLREALDDDGYIYIKAFFPPGSVEAAGGLVMDHLAKMGSVLDPAFPPGSGILRERCGMGCLPFLEGKNELTQSPAIAGVIAGDALSEFMVQLLVRKTAPRGESARGPSLMLSRPRAQGAPVTTLEYKWLRASE